MQKEDAAEQWILLSEVEKEIGDLACRGTLLRWLSSGALKGKKLGSRWIVSRSAIAELMASPAQDK